MSGGEHDSVSGVAIDIAIEGGGWPEETLLRELSAQAVEAVLEILGMDGGSSELSLLFTGDEGVRELNARWRGKDKPTNVLSFPAFPVHPGDALPPMLGDIALAFETVAREAVDEEKPFENHLRHLIVHGVLHLLGYDHETDDEAELMEGLERRALVALAIPDPYA